MKITSWELNATITHDSGHTFTVAWCEDEYAVLKADADGLFGACVLDDSWNCGFTVLRLNNDNEYDYAEFGSLAEAVSYLEDEQNGKHESRACAHEWTEGLDEDGQLVEPAYDVCIHCGARND